MRAMPAVRRLLAWTHSLRARLFLILLTGLVVAHGLSFAVLFLERYASARAVMLSTLQRDVAVSVALLDRLPAAERPDWIPLLDRRNYRYALDPGLPGIPELSGRMSAIAGEIRRALAPRVNVRIEAVPGGRERLQAHLVAGILSGHWLDRSLARAPLPGRAGRLPPRANDPLPRACAAVLKARSWPALSRPQSQGLGRELIQPSASTIVFLLSLRFSE